MKVALFAPVPPEKTGIADYIALLLPALRERIDLTIVRRGSKRPPRGTDLCVYHVGNNPDVHGWIVEALRREPGLVVLHDFVLHHLVAGLTLGTGDAVGYLAALEREGGLAARLLGHGVMEQRIPPLWETRAIDLPLAHVVLDHATALIVHSHYVADRARGAGFAGPISVIPHPAWPVPETAPAVVTGDPLIASFGNLNASKRAPQLLEAFARVRVAHPGARLLFVGREASGFDLARRLQRLGLGAEGIELTGHVDESRLWSLMARADVHVNLRHPTMGETSGTAIRALSLGKPLVVSDVGWFAELPDDVALKVGVDAHEAETLAAALDLLVSRPDVRSEMGRNAVALARGPLAVERIADEQAAAFERAAGGDWVANTVLESVSVAAAAVGLEPGSDETREIARRLSELDQGV